MSWHRLTAAADLGKQMVGERTTAFHATETGRLALGYDRNGASSPIRRVLSHRLQSADRSRSWDEQSRRVPQKSVIRPTLA
jgi:hypothetical protein